MTCRVSPARATRADPWEGILTSWRSLLVNPVPDLKMQARQPARNGCPASFPASRGRMSLFRGKAACPV